MSFATPSACAKSRASILLLDHRDSFTHLLADQIARVDASIDVHVVRAGMTLPDWLACLARIRPILVVLSPGPGHPSEATLALQWLVSKPSTPTFGVCLGHQVIGLAAGAQVQRAVAPVHGEACKLQWHHQPFDEPLPQQMPVARYHSLLVASSVPVADLRILATTRHGQQQLVMAIQHTELPQLGVQFHPESVLTPHGQQLLRSVVVWARQQQMSQQEKQDVTR